MCHIKVDESSTDATDPSSDPSFLHQATQVSAAFDEVQAMDRADVISAAREAGRTKDCADNCESASLARVEELGENLGVVKN